MSATQWAGSQRRGRSGKRLEGERLLWYRIASHLGRTVQEAQQSITSTEFLEWCWYLDWLDTEAFNRQDYYLAQIACDISQAFSRNPGSFTIKKKMLKFRKSAPSRKDVEKQTAEAKQFFKALTGMSARNGVKTKKPPRKGNETAPGEKIESARRKPASRPRRRK